MASQEEVEKLKETVNGLAEMLRGLTTRVEDPNKQVHIEVNKRMEDSLSQISND